MRNCIAQLTPYRPTQSHGIPLHLNTNRLGPNPATRRLAEILDEIDLSNYSDPASKLLRQALARHHKLEPECFLVGNGADEVLDLIFKTLLNPGEVVAYPGPSYVMYPHYALTNGAQIIEVPLDEEFGVDARALLAAEAELLVLCTPNNPTGNVLNSKAVETVLQSGRLVVIDEAYAEFSGDNWLRRVRDFPNLLVARTFSKAYGLAGLRVGYVAANPELIEKIELVRLPYNVNAMSQAVAAAALEEQAFVHEYVTLIHEERPRWRQDLVERGFRVWPSQTNFLLAAVPQGVDRDSLVARLEQAGVLVNSPGAHPRLRSCVRVTVGTPQDRLALVKALDADSLCGQSLA